MAMTMYEVGVATPLRCYVWNVKMRSGRKAANLLLLTSIGWWLYLYASSMTSRRN